MNFEKSMSAFKQLGLVIKNYLTGAENKILETAILKAEYNNPWFIKNFVFTMLNSISQMLQEENLLKWLSKYPEENFTKPTKNIGLVLAGNIPLVGFHDILCVLISGHNIIGKYSSKDEVLTKAIFELLFNIEPDFKNHVHFSNHKLSNIDAIIATGSNNTARYFDYYFGKYPNIIRKNRNSLSILSGNETDEELLKTTHDIFLYFGLGCRNVSKIFLPFGFDIKRLTNAFAHYNFITVHEKYMNNLKYYKTIYSMNGVTFIDAENILLTENYSLHSPVANLHYEYYNNINEINSFVEIEKDNIQCISTSMNFDFDTVKPGQTQFPNLWDYSDNIDTLAFLLNL